MTPMGAANVKVLAETRTLALGSSGAPERSHPAALVGIVSLYCSWHDFWLFGKKHSFLAPYQE